MDVTVKYLASLAEKLGKHSEQLAIERPVTVAQVWQALNPEISMPANTICAINFEYAKPDTVVVDSSELAFFPPVTGG